MSDRIETILIFVAVAEHGSFAEAARRMGRTPAAVTRAVAALEEQLRTRLLNRTTRSVSLTDDGIRYLDVCRRLIAVHEELLGLEIGSEAEPHGTLHMTAPSMFGRLHVLPSIAGFLEKFPRVDVRAMLLDRVVSLVDEGLDVGVRLGELPDSSLRAVKVGEVYPSVYGSPAYLARRGRPQTPHDLARHDIVSCTTTAPIPDRWSFGGVKGVEAVAVVPRLVTNATDAAAEAAALGLGLTFLVSYQVDAQERAGRLERVLLDYALPAIPIHIVHPAGRFVPTKVRLFIDHVGQDLRRSFATHSNGE
jgi:DNA-binding transcriptional LysR family regulator